MPPLEVLLPVAGLALLDTLSPATLGVTLFVLLSGARSIARPLLAYLGTVALFYFALGCVLMLGLNAALDRLSGLSDNPATGWAMVVLGGGLFAYSWVMPTRKHAPRRPAERQGADGPAAVGAGGRREQTAEGGERPAAPRLLIPHSNFVIRHSTPIPLPPAVDTAQRSAAAPARPRSAARRRDNPFPRPAWRRPAATYCP